MTGATPIITPASVGSMPVLIFVQNSRSLARGCDGAPGDGNGARPVTSLIQFAGLPTTPSDQVLLPPVEPSQFTSWAFTNKIRASGMMPSFGSVGDGLDNAMMESFWSSMQIEMLNRKKWKTRLELANAMFDYIEIFYNRQRRHSGLGYRTPIEYELTYENQSIPA